MRPLPRQRLQISAPRAGASCAGTWGYRTIKHNRGSGVRGFVGSSEPLTPLPRLNFFCVFDPAFRRRKRLHVGLKSETATAV